MDFEFNFKERTYYWQTFCAGFETIYNNESNFKNEKYESYFIPVDQIAYYPNEKDCVDNVPAIADSYEYIMDKIICGKFNASVFESIKVVLNEGKYFTIDKSRLKAFKDAYASGYMEFEKIPARLVDSLKKEIRRIRLFSIEQVRQGFVCDDWEEARSLSMYLQNVKAIKKVIESEYKWIKDYLLKRKKNIWIKTIAIPVSIYLEHYEENDSAIELIDLQSLMARY